MKFFFPDSQDQVDPSFDFETEERSELRLRHRDDHYAHEEFENTPFDGTVFHVLYTKPAKLLQASTCPQAE